jgi:hypothetical protein
MDGKLLEFCKIYKRKLSDDEAMKKFCDHKVTAVWDMMTGRKPETNIFTVHHWRSGRHYDQSTVEVFTLDDEDLKYLYDKYSKKLGEELELEKQKLDGIYKAAIAIHTSEDSVSNG